MRWFLRLLAVAALTASFTLSASAGGKKTASPLPIEPTCGDHGTSVKFAKDPKEAATKAAKEEKLVLVIHISGYFEEPDYT